MVTVAVAHPPSMKIQVGGHGGGHTSGGGGGRRPRWREKQRGSAGSRNQVREAGFFAVFGLKFLHPLSMKIKSIYKWWKRDTLSLLVQTLSHWFDPKASQPLAQCSNDKLSVLQEKQLARLATLRQCHRLCSLDQPERLTLACSKVSQDRLCVSFIQFGEETRCQMPWEGGYPTGLARKEDEQYLMIQSFNL